MRTLRAEQIKKTKTIRRAYMCDIKGVYRRLITAKNASRHLSISIFCGTGFYKRREKNHKEKKKDDHPLAIGENYINKMFLFF
jgi:predicted metal-dependent phosphotriesterase family hydrolase